MVMEGCREPSHLPSPRCVSAALETARNSGPDRARCKFAAGLAKPENRIRKEPRAGWQQGPREAKRGGAELECARPEMVTPRRYQPTRQTMERVRSQKILRDNVLAGPRLMVCDARLLLLLLAVRPLVLRLEIRAVLGVREFAMLCTRISADITAR